MKIFLIICIVTTSVVSATSAQCEGKEVRGLFHKIDVLEKNLKRPYQLSYYKEKHEIFYSHNVGNDAEDRFEIRRLPIGENVTGEKIEGVENGFATAIDNGEQIIYFGGSDGVHEYNLPKETLRKIIDNHDIWDMFFGKHLYYITYPKQHLYKYYLQQLKNSKEREWKAVHEHWIHEKIYQFAIDNDDDTFFMNATGLYMVKSGTQHRTHITGIKIFRCVTLNNDGEAYFCGKNGIYTVDKKKHALKEVTYVKNIFGLAFDKAGHIIYSTPSKIIKLTPSLCKIIDGIAKYEPMPITELIASSAKTGKSP